MSPFTSDAAPDQIRRRDLHDALRRLGLDPTRVRTLWMADATTLRVQVQSGDHLDVLHVPVTDDPTPEGVPMLTLPTRDPRPFSWTQPVTTTTTTGTAATVNRAVVVIVTCSTVTGTGITVGVRRVDPTMATVSTVTVTATTEVESWAVPRIVGVGTSATTTISTRTSTPICARRTSWYRSWCRRWPSGATARW